MTGYGATIKFAERLELKEAVETAIANGRSNAWILRAFAPVPFAELPYERLVRIKEQMGFRYADVPPSRRQARQVKPCGTEAAYRRHRERGEVPCRPCVDARQAERAARGETWKARKRARVRRAEVDLLAVEAALLGRPVKLRNTERLEAIRLGLSRGLTQRVVADRLRLTLRTVQRHQSAMRRAAREAA